MVPDGLQFATDLWVKNPGDQNGTLVFKISETITMGDIISWETLKDIEQAVQLA